MPPLSVLLVPEEKSKRAHVICVDCTSLPISTQKTIYILKFVEFSWDKLCLNTCVCSGEGAENARVLRRPVVDLHNVVQGSLEEGELTEDHWEKKPKKHLRRQWKLELDPLGRESVKVLKVFEQLKLQFGGINYPKVDNTNEEKRVGGGVEEQEGER